MTELVIRIVRHVETLENAAGIHQGVGVGGCLSPRGEAQAVKLGKYLRTMTFDSIYLSPVARVQATWAILTSYLGHPSAHLASQLSAKDSGSLAGRPREAILEEAMLAGISVFDYRPQCGESSRDVQRRVIQFFNDVMCTTDNHVLVITHGGVIALFSMHLLGASEHEYPKYVAEPGAITTVVGHRRSGTFQIVSQGEVSHLL